MSFLSEARSWPLAAPADGLGNPWFSGRYPQDNTETMLAALREHATLTTQAVIMAVLVALPLAILAFWFKPLLCVSLALLLDLLLAGIGRLLTPWTRGLRA